MPMSVECGCVPGHRMLVTTSVCADCGFSEQEFAEHGNRPCVPSRMVTCRCGADVDTSIRSQCDECGGLVL